ncbi:MAG: peptidyl-dipeptidase Dcp, partial [Cyclobacteriaceae bacterium]
MSNPFLINYITPFEVPPFDEIKHEHYMPAIEKGIEEAKKEVIEIAENQEKPSFSNTIIALEKSGELLGRVTSVLFNL